MIAGQGLSRRPRKPRMPPSPRASSQAIEAPIRALGQPPKKAGPRLRETRPVGSGGFRRGCLKVVRHLENCKFTKLADAVEGTRNIWPAGVDAPLVSVSPT